MKFTVNPFCILLIPAILAATTNPIIRTTNGLVKGAQNRTVDQNTLYYSFRGIPYAQPPINNLRFRSPVLPNNWDNTLDATQEKNMCVQFDEIMTRGSEDCLFINVYTPQLPEGETNPNLSVMVWIHGGYFLQGSGNYASFGPDFLLNEGVIYVSFNYRLGIFGFLSTQDEAAPGNFGLKDQIFALQWVQNNIAAFGGDPNKVTIFGESAGSASVSYLTQSPRSNGLYQRAIMQSGTTMCLWAFSRRSREAAFDVGLLSGIITRNSTQLVNRLRQISYRYLNNISLGSSLTVMLAESPLAGFIFAPVVEPISDDAILTEGSHATLQQLPFNNITYLIGFNSLEGKFFADVLNQVRLYLLTYDIAPTRLVPVDMNVDKRNTEIVANEILHEYFGRDLIVFSNDNLLKFLSDDQFVRPIRETIRLLSRHSKVYMYEFSYEGLLGSDNIRTPGVGHSEDLYYIFRRDRDSLNVSNMDITTRYRLVRMWANFAKTGNPTPESDPLLQNAQWPPTSIGNNFAYLNIGNNLVLGQNPYQRGIDFYRSLYDVYGHPPYDTY